MPPVLPFQKGPIGHGADNAATPEDFLDSKANGSDPRMPRCADISRHDDAEPSSHTHRSFCPFTMRTLFLCTMLLAAPLRLLAQATGDERAVLQTVQAFFDALATRDTAAARRAILENGQYYAVRPSGDSSIVSRSTHVQFLATLSRGTDKFLERMWNPTVHIRGPIAQVWTPYDFHRNGTFSHCGIDSFSLIRTKAGWRIAGIVYTVEPTGCSPSPLGAPRP